MHTDGQLSLEGRIVLQKSAALLAELDANGVSGAGDVSRAIVSILRRIRPKK